MPAPTASLLRNLADMIDGQEDSTAVKEPTPMKVAKIDEDESLVFGWASVAEDAEGRLIIDSDGELIEKEELERAVYEYVLDFRKGSDRHNGKSVARLVESLVLTKEKAEAMGIEAPVIGWWVGFKVDDPDVFAKVKDGTYSMFSIGGTATKEPAL